MKKKLLLVVVIIIVIAAGTLYYFKSTRLADFQPQIKERLSKLVLEASNGLYRLDMDTLQVDVVNSKIILVNARLTPDTVVYARMEQSKEAPNDLFDIVVDQLSIDDIKPADFFANKRIDLRRIFINGPNVKVYHKKQPYNLPDTSSINNVYEKIKKDISSIRLDTVVLQNINFTYVNRNKGNKETRLSNVKVYLAGILIDSATQHAKNRFLYAENCAINLKDYQVDTGDSLYRFKVDDLEIQTIAQSMTLKGLRFSPRLAVTGFYKRIGHQQDYFNLTVNRILFERVQWWELLSEDKIEAGKISLQNGSLTVFNDKSQPVDKRSKVGKYPHQLLMKLKFPLAIDTVSLNNLDISYTELNPKSGMKGSLLFSNASGIIRYVSNIPERIKQHPEIIVQAKADFMNTSAVSARFNFSLAEAARGAFGVTASVGKIEAAALNKITVPLGMLKLNSLTVNSLEAEIRGDNLRASGTVKMLYQDLNITALKSADDTLKKRRLLSFVANQFVIKQQNPTAGDAPRVEQASFVRVKERSFFNLVWKTIFTGAGKTVGYNKK